MDKQTLKDAYLLPPWQRAALQSVKYERLCKGKEFNEDRRPVHPYMRGLRHRSIFEPWVTDADLPHDGEHFQQYVQPNPWVTHYDATANPDQGFQIKTITREEMKRKLSSEQFKSRLMPPHPAELEAMLGYYVQEVEQGLDRKVLLTEIPLRLTEAKNQQGGPELVALVLVGYRIYQVKRSNPDTPELLAAYSKLTRKWHRVGFASNMGDLLGGRSPYTPDGCYSLGDLSWDKSPQSVGDDVIRRCMLMDAAAQAGVNGYNLRAAVTRGCRYALQELGGWSEAESKVLPPYLLLFRHLRSKPLAFTKMLALVDLYGMPDGILGEVFAHHDKFRTL